MSSADTVNNNLTANCCLSMRKGHCFVSVGKRSVVREKGSSTKYVPLGGEGGGVFLNLVFIPFSLIIKTVNIYHMSHNMLFACF